MDGYHTFRLRPTQSSAKSAVVVKPRKSHKKSRLGCVTCKTKKLKCDEGKPACLHCSRRSLPCEYARSDAGTALQRSKPTSAAKEILPAPVLYATCSPVPSSATLISASLSHHDKAADDVVLGALDFELLSHFEHETCSTIAGPTVQRVYRDELVKIAVDHLYLMDAILAMALLHRHMLRSPSVAPHQKLIHHWKRCLSGFASRLSKGVNTNDADAMLATSTLVSGVAFALVDTQPPSLVWPLTSRSYDWSWLYISRGITIVFEALPPVRDDSALKRLFDKTIGVDDDPKPIDACRNTHFQNLSNLCTATDMDRDRYQNTLQMFAPLSQMECSAETVLIHLGFIGALSNDFIDLLQRRDHRALLIMSYWYANLCPYECWWVSARPRRECAAICRYLDEHADQRIRNMLSLPAQAAGYSQIPIHLQDSQPLSSTLVPCATM